MISEQQRFFDILELERTAQSLYYIFFVTNVGNAHRMSDIIRVSVLIVVGKAHDEIEYKSPASFRK